MRYKTGLLVRDGYVPSVYEKDGTVWILRDLDATLGILLVGERGICKTHITRAMDFGKRMIIPLELC
jgi:hypothetical protein